MENFAIIVCTKDRPFDMVRLLKSIAMQSIKPELIIIVDGSDDPIKKNITSFTNIFNIDYVTVRPPSLPKQRNVGIKRLPPNIHWAAFLDDDLELLPNSLQAIFEDINTFKTSKPIGALCMLIENQPNVEFKPLNRFWLLDAKKSGIFLKSGIPTYLRKSDLTEEVQWVSGGTTIWNADVLRQYKYDEWFEGTGYFEDVDYSYTVSKDYSLLLCGRAKCNHYQHPTPKAKIKSLGIWQITTLWYFVVKNKEFTKILTLWSMLGILINNLIFGALRPNTRRIIKSWGNLQGFFLILNGNALKRRTFHKGV